MPEVLEVQLFLTNWIIVIQEKNFCFYVDIIQLLYCKAAKYMLIKRC